MIEITPKILAPNIISFLFRRLSTGIGWNIKHLFKLFLIVTFLLLITLKISKNSRFFDSAQELILFSFGISILFFLSIFVLVQFSIYIFEWPCSFQYDEDKVVIKNRFSEKKFRYDEVEKIVLQSKLSAQILFRSSYSLKVSRWYGNSRSDWLKFVNHLESKSLKIDSIVWIQYFEGIGLAEKKMESASAAYSYFESK